MQPLIIIGIFVILIGFVIFVTGILLSGQSEVNGGAIIFIGPVPIAFGTDRNSLLIIFVLIILIMLIAYALFRSK